MDDEVVSIRDLVPVEERPVQLVPFSLMEGEVENTASNHFGIEMSPIG